MIAARVQALLARYIAPPPLLRPSEWIESHVSLPPGSPIPGRYRFHQTPYMREPIDCLGPDSQIKQVTLVAGTQIGKSQAMLSLLAYWIANNPAPILLVLPTTEMAKRVVMTRMNPLFSLIPSVMERLIPERSRESGNSMFLKKIIGGSELMITGANSPVPLRSSPINFCLLDECSTFPDSTRDGDVLELVGERQSNYKLTKKTMMVSTPLNDGTCLITNEYLKTDQRKYFIPCIHCGEFWVVTWGDIQYPTDRPDLAALICPSCGGVHSDYDKPDQLFRGEWRATAVSENPTAAGFHFPGMLSPWKSYPDMAVKFRSVHKDPAKLKVFVNSTITETWKDEAGESLDVDGLPARRQDHKGVLPEWTVAVTCGVDCQDDRLELSWWAWGSDERSLCFRHRILHGDPSSPALWTALDAALAEPIPHARQLPDLLPSAVAIDSGGHFTSNVYAFCKTRSKRRVWAIRGKAGSGVPLWPNDKKLIYRAKGGCKVHSIGVDQAKRLIYSRLKISQADAPAYISFDASLPDQYFDQLTVERLVTRYSRGKMIQEWITPPHARNEALDCGVYAMAALHSLYLGGLDLNREAARIAEIPLKTPETPSAPALYAPPPRQRIYRSSLFA